jgi:hypothetical protein
MGGTDTCMVKMRNVHNILVEIVKGKDYSEDLGVNRKKIRGWILGKQGWRVWTGRL